MSVISKPPRNLLPFSDSGLTLSSPSFSTRRVFPAQLVRLPHSSRTLPLPSISRLNTRHFHLLVEWISVSLTSLRSFFSSFLISRLDLTPFPFPCFFSSPASPSAWLNFTSSLSILSCLLFYVSRQRRSHVSLSPSQRSSRELEFDSNALSPLSSPPTLSRSCTSREERRHVPRPSKARGRERAKEELKPRCKAKRKKRINPRNDASKQKRTPPQTTNETRIESIYTSLTIPTFCLSTATLRSDARPSATIPRCWLICWFRSFVKRSLVDFFWARRDCGLGGWGG